jgi:hypothetical protein
MLSRFIITDLVRWNFYVADLQNLFYSMLIESLMCSIGISNKVRVIDLTRKEGTSSGLVETRFDVYSGRERYLFVLYVASVSGTDVGIC